MSAFGNLWNENHHLTVNPDPAGTGTLNFELIDTLSKHLTTQHMRELRHQMATCWARLRAETYQLKRERFEFERWLQGETLRIALWNDTLLKQLNSEGIYP